MMKILTPHQPCHCIEYTSALHSGEIDCPVWGRKVAQCFICGNCKYCRLSANGEIDAEGSEWFWRYSPTIPNNTLNTAERGRYNLANALSGIVVRCHITAVAKGFWTTDETLQNTSADNIPVPDNKRHFAENLMWAVREISEAFDNWQRGKDEDIAEELADACIILFDAAEGHGYDIVTAMMEKLETNRNRPRRHGGKRTS